MTDVALASPWRQVLGDELDALHPKLANYFALIPVGNVGRGRGVFDSVGTPRRWLYPVLALLGASGVVFPVWEREVPFTVENRQDGRQLLRSRGVGWRRIPFPFAPTVTLLERCDERAGRQHVDLTMDAPLIGRIYGYSGYFDYIVEDA